MVEGQQHTTTKPENVQKNGLELEGYHQNVVWHGIYKTW